MNRRVIAYNDRMKIKNTLVVSAAAVAASCASLADGARISISPNYHVQKMFGNNLPSVYIPSAQSGEVADFHQVCGFDKATGEYVVKCVNLAADHALDLVVDFGAELPAGKIKVETLTGDPKVVNDMENPERCRPEAKSVVFAGGREFKTNLPASSLTIIRAKE